MRVSGNLLAGKRHAGATVVAGRASHPWAARAVALAMFAASLALWLAVPPLWLTLLHTLGATGAGYALGLLALPAMLAGVAIILAMLNALHGRLTGSGRNDALLVTALTTTLLIALVIAAAWVATRGVPWPGHSLGPLPD
jgi:hypothetical protein